MLLQLFRRKAAYGKIYSPCIGKIYPITMVHDHQISERMIGDGFAVMPENGVVKAPADGVVTRIDCSGKLFQIRTADGQYIEVRIGLCSRDQIIRGLRILKNRGAKVRHGEPILELDLSSNEKEFDTSVITVLPCAADHTRTEIHLERSCSEPIIEYGED